MRVFVAGSTGAVGRPLVKELLARGHDVVGLTRSADKARWLADLGARPLVGDALDTRWLEGAIRAEEPEVVIDQLTDLPQRLRPRGMGRFYRRQIPLREVGSRALLRAAEQIRARRLIAQSVAFLYAPDGGGLKTEVDRPWIDAPGVFGRAVDGAARHDERVVRSEGSEGIVLRYGVFYGPGTMFSPGNGLYEDIRRRRLPLAGEGGSVWSFIQVDDAAQAAVAALESGERGVYNVVDDDPTPMREWLPEYARLIGAKPPRRLPPWLVRLGAGEAMAVWLTDFPGASNRKARAGLRWSPRFASWRDGFRAGIPGIERGT